MSKTNNSVPSQNLINKTKLYIYLRGLAHCMKELRKDILNFLPELEDDTEPLDTESAGYVTTLMEKCITGCLQARVMASEIVEEEEPDKEVFEETLTEALEDSLTEEPVRPKKKSKKSCKKCNSSNEILEEHDPAKGEEE
jgi:hypothetical protein